MVEASTVPRGLTPLKITCTSTDCSNNLHCFRMTRKLREHGMNGRCRACGAALVDWDRIHRRDASDAAYTFEALRFELIRHHFWHIPVSPFAINYARRKGRIDLRAAAARQIRRLVGGALNVREGYQTPRETSPNANAIHFAQHAVAACCRKCIAEWHAIKEGQELTPSELEYLVELVARYIDARIPDLDDAPAFVPRRVLRAPTTQN
jgi:uncharacterized heparinase superfamily protein